MTADRESGFVRSPGARPLQSGCAAGSGIHRHLLAADALTREAEAAAAPEDVASQVSWRAVRARVLDVRGESAEAERLVREAAFLAEGTDDLRLRGETLVDLAVVLAPAAAAAAHFDDAAAFLERKGVVPLLAATRRLREEYGV